MDEKSDHETDPEWNEKNDRSLVRIDLKTNRLINKKKYVMASSTMIYRFFSYILYGILYQT